MEEENNQTVFGSGSDIDDEEHENRVKKSVFKPKDYPAASNRSITSNVSAASSKSSTSTSRNVERNILPPTLSTTKSSLITKRPHSTTAKPPATNSNVITTIVQKKNPSSKVNINRQQSNILKNVKNSGRGSVNSQLSTSLTSAPSNTLTNAIGQLTIGGPSKTSTSTTTARRTSAPTTMSTGNANYRIVITNTRTKSSHPK